MFRKCDKNKNHRLNVTEAQNCFASLNLTHSQMDVAGKIFKKLAVNGTVNYQGFKYGYGLYRRWNWKEYRAA